jgi:hypothetical protein
MRGCAYFLSRTILEIADGTETPNHRRINSQRLNPALLEGFTLGFQSLGRDGCVPQSGGPCDLRRAS